LTGATGAGGFGCGGGLVADKDGSEDDSLGIGNELDCTGAAGVVVWLPVDTDCWLKYEIITIMPLTIVTIAASAAKPLLRGDHLEGGSDIPLSF
jgi:hypothetical protein